MSRAENEFDLCTDCGSIEVRYACSECGRNLCYRCVWEGKVSGEVKRFCRKCFSVDKIEIGECIDCGFEDSSFICSLCGGFICAECAEAFGDGTYLCWNCVQEKYYEEKRRAEKVNEG